MPKAPTPSTNVQWGAINNAANGNSLVSQLYAGKPSVTTTPSVQAASSQVKSPSAPVASPFKTSIPGANSSLTPALNALSTNMKAFNPATVGQFNTTPPTQPSGPLSTAITSTNPLNAGSLNLNQPVNQTSLQNANAAPTQTNASTTAPVTSTPVGTANGIVQANNSPTSYPGIIGNLVNTSQKGSAVANQIAPQLSATSAASSPAATAAEQATADAAQLNPALAANAAQIGSQYSTEMNNLVNQEGSAVSGNTTGGSGPIGLGRAGEIEANVGAQLTGESNAEKAALAGNAQGLTAANQQATAEAAAGTIANNQQANIQSGESAAGTIANTSQSNVQSGLNSAGVLASPVAQYGALTNPQTGEAISGGSSGGTLPASAQSFVSSLAQQVQSGNLTRADAESQLSAYGPAGLTALNSALGNNFNTVQSNANAASTATNLSNTSSQAQQTQQAVTYANSVLDDLSTAYNALPWGQSTGFTPANAIGGLLSSTGILGGNSAAASQAYASTQTEAIAAITQALTTGGVTPSDAGSIASTMLPPNATPAQIAAAKTALQTFLAQRQSTYTTPPAAASYSNTSNVAGGQNPTSTSIYGGWSSLGD